MTGSIRPKARWSRARIPWNICGACDSTSGLGTSTPVASDERVEIWTDGGCKPNPGPGGWAAILRFRGVEKELSGYDPATTNNRMELTAAAAALEALKKPSRVRSEEHT